MSSANWSVLECGGTTGAWACAGETARSAARKGETSGSERVKAPKVRRHRFADDAPFATSAPASSQVTQSQSVVVVADAPVPPHSKAPQSEGLLECGGRAPKVRRHRFAADAPFATSTPGFSQVTQSQSGVVVAYAPVPQHSKAPQSEGLLECGGRAPKVRLHRFAADAPFATSTPGFSQGTQSQSGVVVAYAPVPPHSIISAP